MSSGRHVPQVWGGGVYLQYWIAALEQIHTRRHNPFRLCLCLCPPLLLPVRPFLCSHALSDPQAHGCPFHMPGRKSGHTVTKYNWIFIQRRQASCLWMDDRSDTDISPQEVCFNFTTCSWRDPHRPLNISRAPGVCFFPADLFFFKFQLSSSSNYFWKHFKKSVSAWAPSSSLCFHFICAGKTI